MRECDLCGFQHETQHGTAANCAKFIKERIAALKESINGSREMHDRFVATLRAALAKEKQRNEELERQVKRACENFAALGEEKCALANACLKAERQRDAVIAKGDIME